MSVTPKLCDAIPSMRRHLIHRHSFCEVGNVAPTHGHAIDKRRGLPSLCATIACSPRKKAQIPPTKADEIADTHTFVPECL